MTQFWHHPPLIVELLAHHSHFQSTFNAHHLSINNSTELILKHCKLETFDGRGPRYSTATRLQLVGPLPLDAQPAAICLCTVLRCLARVRMMAPMAEVVEVGGLGEGGVEGAGQGEGGGIYVNMYEYIFIVICIYM